MKINFTDDKNFIIGPSKTDHSKYDVGILLNSCD